MIPTDDGTPTDHGCTSLRDPMHRFILTTSPGTETRPNKSTDQRANSNNCEFLCHAHVGLSSWLSLYSCRREYIIPQEGRTWQRPYRSFWGRPLLIHISAASSTGTASTSICMEKIPEVCRGRLQWWVNITKLSQHFNTCFARFDEIELLGVPYYLYCITICIRTYDYLLILLHLDYQRKHW